MSHKKKSTQPKSSEWKSDSYSDRTKGNYSDKTTGNNSYSDKSDSDSQNYSD